MRRLGLVDLAAFVVVALVAVDAVGADSPSGPTSSADPGAGSGRPAIAFLPIRSPVPRAGALPRPSPPPSRIVDPTPSSTHLSPTVPGATVPPASAASGSASGATPTVAAVPTVAVTQS